MSNQAQNGTACAARRNGAAALLVCLSLAPAAVSQAPSAGSPGAPGLALLADKILTCADGDASVVDQGVLLVRDGLIEAIGLQNELVIPEGYEQRDLGSDWLMPGMINLHCHTAGTSIFEGNDLNDDVYLANPGLRVSSTVIPYNESLRRGMAGGVTTVLFIPGSATNLGGQGLLLKTGLKRYEDMRLRDPGSLKLAQAGNPERWFTNPGRCFMNWNTRHTLKRGVAYAKACAAGEVKGPRDPMWDVFHGLIRGEVQISAHTQIYQVVLATITIIKRDLGLPVFLDHSEIGGWKTAALAKQYEVPAIVGPRSIDTTSAVFQRLTAARELGIRGLAAGWQEGGLTEIGFNTDSPVVPEEELSVQATMALRYGFRDDNLESVRGLTIVPARAAGIDHLVGSLEVGKQADILVIDGHPADPRTTIKEVWIEGEQAYFGAAEGRLW